MASSVSERSNFASYSGITQNIRFKTDGKTIRAEVWDKSSGKLLATIVDLFLEVLPSKTPQETLSWMLKNNYTFYWTQSQTRSQSLVYHPTLCGGNDTQLLDQLNDPDLITALLNDPARAQAYVKAIQDNPSLKDQLFAIILASRGKTDFLKAIRAANSISLLNAARVPFSGLDLSGIRIPGAHLWGAILDHTCLDRADLTNVILRKAFLRGCSLNGAKMGGVEIRKAYSQYILDHSALTVSPTGKFLATFSGNIRSCVHLFENVIDSNTGKRTFRFLATLEEPTQCINSLTFFPEDENILAVQGWGDHLSLWEVITLPETGKKKVLRLSTFRGSVDFLTFSPDGKFLAGIAEDTDYYHLRLWEVMTDPETGKKKVQLHTKFDGQTKELDLQVFSPDVKILVTAGYDKKVRLWEVMTDPEADQKKLQLLTIFDDHSKDVNSLRFSPDGKILVTAGLDGKVRLWEVMTVPETGKKQLKLHTTFDDHLKSVDSLRFSPDGKILVTAGLDDEVRLWEVMTDPEADQKKLQLLTIFYDHSKGVDSLRFSPDGKILVTAGLDDKVRLWEVMTVPETGKKQLHPLTIFDDHLKSVDSLRFSPDGKILVTAGLDYKVRLWEVPRVDCENSTKAFKPFVILKNWGRIEFLEFTPDSNFLITFDYNPNPLWRVPTPSDAKKINKMYQSLVPFEGHKDRVHNLTFSSDGNLATESYETFRLWKKRRGTFQLLTILEGHTEEVDNLTFSPDGEIRAGNYGQTVRLSKKVIDPNTKRVTFQPLVALRGHTEGVTSVAFSPDGKVLATGSYDKTVRLWKKVIDPKIKKSAFHPLATLEGHTKKVTSIAFSPDGALLVTGSDDKTVRLWKKVIDPKVKRIAFHHLATLEGHTKGVTSIAFSPDGALLVTGSDDKTVRSWKLFNGQGVFEPRLMWISTPNSLFSKGAQIEGVKGLSLGNYALLIQRGALESSTPLALDDDSTSLSTQLPLGKTSGKKPIIERSREAPPLTSLEDAIQDILEWIDQQFPERNFDSETAEVNLYIKKLCDFAGECKKSPPKDEAELQVVEYFEDQLKAFQAYYGNNGEGNTSSLRLLPFPNLESSVSNNHKSDPNKRHETAVSFDANQPPKTEGAQPSSQSASEGSMLQPSGVSAVTSNPSPSEQKKRRNVGTVRRTEAKNSQVQMVAFQKEIESIIDQRELTHQNEIERVSQRVQALEEGSKETQKTLKEIIHEETSSLNTEIEKIEEVLKNIETWKAADESYKKESEASKEELLRIEQLISQTRILYQQELKRLQEQQQLLSDQHAIQEDKLKPIHEKYLQKEKILKEQKRLMSLDQVHAFYKALEKNLGSKFQASILLTSNLIQRKAVKKDLLAGAAEYGIEGVFGFIAGVISVGTLGVSTVIVGTAAAVAGVGAGKAAGELISGQIDKKYENRAKEVSAIMSNPKHAWGVAELVARRVSNHYFEELKKTTAEENQKLAQDAADILYQFIASGKLKEQSFKTEDEMIGVLLKVIQEHIEAEKKKKNTTSKKRCEIL